MSGNADIEKKRTGKVTAESDIVKKEKQWTSFKASFGLYMLFMIFYSHEEFRPNFGRFDQTLFHSIGHYSGSEL